MFLNGLPYEEYKGFYLAPGITMPSQGIHEWSVYASAEKVVEDIPLVVFDSKQEAVNWVDEYDFRRGGAVAIEGGITPDIDRLRSEFYSELSKAHIDETEAGPMYDHVAELAEALGYFPQRDALKGIAADERRHRDIVYQMMERVPPPY